MSGNHSVAAPSGTLLGDELLPLVYDELRQLAAAKLSQEKPGQTIQATALVHEAYLRLMGAAGQQRWDSPGHFFAAAAEAMRRILINRARDKGRLKRGGGWQRVDLDQVELPFETPPDAMLLLDEALAKLAEHDALGAELVKLHFFAGLRLDAAADCLGISQRTAERLWAYARACLYEQLRQENDSGEK